MHVPLVTRLPPAGLFGTAAVFVPCCCLLLVLLIMYVHASVYYAADALQLHAATQLLHMLVY
jgi:hypothetical protein